MNFSFTVFSFICEGFLNVYRTAHSLLINASQHSLRILVDRLIFPVIIIAHL